MLQKEYLLARIGFDTAENEPPNISMVSNINPLPLAPLPPGLTGPISSAQVPGLHCVHPASRRFAACWNGEGVQKFLGKRRVVKRFFEMRGSETAAKGGMLEHIRR